MKRLALAVAVLLLTTVVNAQIYQWKDENGKTVMSDKPPVGAAHSNKKVDDDAPASNAAPQKTLADRDLDFRKRQQESQKKTEEAQKDQTAAAAKQENCERARRYLTSLESGERIALLNDKGERYYMEDTQRQQETAKAREAVQASCK